MWGRYRWGTALWGGSQSVSFSGIVGELFSIVANVPIYRTVGNVDRFGVTGYLITYRSR